MSSTPKVHRRNQVPESCFPGRCVFGYDFLCFMLIFVCVDFMSMFVQSPSTVMDSCWSSSHSWGGDFIAVRRRAEIVGGDQQHDETGRTYGEEAVRILGGDRNRRREGKGFRNRLFLAVGISVSAMEEEVVDVRFHRNVASLFLLLETASGGNFRVPPVFFDSRASLVGWWPVAPGPF